jgi:hypothetical protein
MKKGSVLQGVYGMSRSFPGAGPAYAQPEPRPAAMHPTYDSSSTMEGAGIA